MDMCKGIRDLREEERNLGIEQRTVSLMIKKCKKNKSFAEIADELEASPEELQDYYAVILKHAPDYDMQAIMEEINSGKATA